MRAILIALLSAVLLAGCSSQQTSKTGSMELTQAALESVQTGMTLAEAESKLGPDHTMAASFGDAAAVYSWQEGEGDSTRSIILEFREGKVFNKSGINLK